MKSLADWLRAHPQVNASMFERNYKKQTGSGKFEDVCGFCLASRHFRSKPPILCKFCKAPIRETRSISDLPEVLDQKWRLIEKWKARDKGRLTGSQESSSAATAARSRKRPVTRRLATLSPYEDKCWVFAFNYYLDRGKTKREADKLAWIDLQLEFPRLREYDGCGPSYGRSQMKSK